MVATVLLAGCGSARGSETARPPNPPPAPTGPHVPHRPDGEASRFQPVVYRWPTREVCVENRAPLFAPAVEWAVAELDTTELTVNYRRGAGGCSGQQNRVVVVARHVGEDERIARTHPWEHDRPGPDGTRLLGSPVRIVFNLDQTGYTWRYAEMVALHELLHAVMWIRGPEWDREGHTSRCDSVLSRVSAACVFAQGGLTAYDREQIRLAYGGGAR